MVEVLPSYIRGSWRTGNGEGVVVNDAITGVPVVRVTSAGLDLGSAVAAAREIGGPALSAMTFQERAAALKVLAGALSERKGELYERSARAGALRTDAAVDVDGGIGTTMVYASLGRRNLPDSTVFVEDDPIPLGKRGTFAGRHVLTSRRGLALQINAYNFPVWGMLEKLAPAVLAGVPTIVKPATPTAYIASHAVRIAVESGALPDGAIQLVSGSIPGLFDLLGGQDLIGFTGSAKTAARLRADAAVTSRSARFVAEADSLNSSILGPDAVPGTPEFDLYLDQVVTEMTTKAGQKCTAIRRILVPVGQQAEVVDALRERLSKVVVGAPGVDGVTMGALVGKDQRDDVRRQAKRLAESSMLVFGDPANVDVVGADAGAGAFLSPLLFNAADSAAPEPHEVEAFGPVSTVIGYRDRDDLVSLLERGEGSLAGSVVTHDDDFAKDLVLSAAAFHGRLLVLDRTSADESTGHGIPMPQLVHGGPGRAGGGEEEGGLRAVFHHMQRSAVQAHPRLLDNLG